MDATKLQTDRTLLSTNAETQYSGLSAALPDDVQSWLAQAPSDLIPRWRMELWAGLRDDDGRLTCANLNEPEAPLSEARRISDALMEPMIRNWLASPPTKLLREWKSVK